MSFGKLLIAAVGVAALAAIAVGMIFFLGLDRKVTHAHLPFMAYILVAGCVALVSFVTLCGFVRYNMITSLNVTLFLGVMAATISFCFSFHNGPFVASFAFELVACAAVMIGLLFSSKARRAI